MTATCRPRGGSLRAAMRVGGRAPVALLAGVVAGCGTVFPAESPAPSATRRSFPPPTVSESPAATPSPTPEPTLSPPTEWEAVVFDRPTSPASIQALAVRGPVLIAVGGVGGQGAAWNMERGGEWERAEQSPTVADSVVTLVDVAAAPTGLVAVGIGGAPQSEPSFSVIWYSADGIRWREVARPPGVLLEVVTPGGPGMIAAGGVGPAVGYPHGVSLWSSPDGTTWSEVPGTDGLGIAAFNDIVQSPSGLVAVGVARDDPAVFEFNAAVWTSSDGTAWTRVPHTPLFDAGGMNGVAIGSGAFVAVSLDLAAGRSRPAVWTSGNGTEWQRLPLADEEGGMNGVAPADGGFIAVGNAQAGEGGRLGLWTSPDAVTWTLEPAVSAEGTGFLHDVVAFSGRSIAAGEVVDQASGEAHPIVISGPLP